MYDAYLAEGSCQNGCIDRWRRDLSTIRGKVGDQKSSVFKNPLDAQTGHARPASGRGGGEDPRDQLHAVSLASASDPSPLIREQRLSPQPLPACEPVLKVGIAEADNLSPIFQ